MATTSAQLLQRDLLVPEAVKTQGVIGKSLGDDRLWFVPFDEDISKPTGKAFEVVGASTEIERWTGTNFDGLGEALRQSSLIGAFDVTSTVQGDPTSPVSIGKIGWLKVSDEADRGIAEREMIRRISQENAARTSVEMHGTFLVLADAVSRAGATLRVGRNGRGEADAMISYQGNTVGTLTRDIQAPQLATLSLDSGNAAELPGKVKSELVKSEAEFRSMMQTIQRGI